MAALEHGLAGPALRWLRALAVYPDLRWPLSLHVGAQLASGSVEETRRHVLSLARLPWLRAGVLPHWLRRELLSGMPASEEATIRDILLGGKGRGSRVELDIQRPRSSLGGGVRRDGIFLDFAYGMNRLRGIPVRLTGRLSALLRLRRVRRLLYAAAGGLIVATGVSLLWLSLIPLDGCDAMAADVYDRERVGAGIEFKLFRFGLEHSPRVRQR